MRARFGASTFAQRRVKRAEEAVRLATDELTVRAREEKKERVGTLMTEWVPVVHLRAGARGGEAAARPPGGAARWSPPSRGLRSRGVIRAPGQRGCRRRPHPGARGQGRQRGRRALRRRRLAGDAMRRRRAGRVPHIRPRSARRGARRRRAALPARAGSTSLRSWRAAPITTSCSTASSASAPRATRRCAAAPATVVEALLPAVRAGRPRVIAVDLPSGLHPDDGTSDDVVLPASVTVTFGAVKAGLVAGSGAELAGPSCSSTSGSGRLWLMWSRRARHPSTPS